MSRYTPPMYRKVVRKAPPQRKRNSAKPAPAPTPQPIAEEAPVKKPVTLKQEEPKTVAKKTKKKASKKKSAPKVKALEWDKDMTQKELYRLAKDAGLDVRSRDYKKDLIAAIKKHNRKAK